jgi:uncharacterized membrane protein
MLLYERRLSRDIDRWQAAGIVSAETATAMRADVAGRARGIASLAPVLAILGAVLLAFAAMSFVAANWQEMSKLLRLALLLGGLWATYGVAGALSSRASPAFADAAILLASALFGASIMLIAQMYHIDGHPPDAVLTWAFGTLLAGVALRSNPALALAMILVGLWSGWETSISDRTHWPFLAGWLAVTAALAWQCWHPGVHIAGAALAAWTIMLGYTLGSGHGGPGAHGVVTVIGLASVAGIIVSERAWPDLAKLGIAPAALGYAMIVAFAGLLALQFEGAKLPVDALILYASLTLGLLLAAIVWGSRANLRNVLWLGYAGFSIEILALYFRTIGTLLGSSLFFLLTGLIVIALAGVAWRLHARTQGKEALP